MVVPATIVIVDLTSKQAREHVFFLQLSKLDCDLRAEAEAPAELDLANAEGHAFDTRPGHTDFSSVFGRCPTTSLHPFGRSRTNLANSESSSL